jgi:aspartate/methionine/tyrosine aminotransferase
VTGWRLGYAIAPAPITDAIRKVHDFLTVGAPHPLQAAAAAALNLGDEFYRGLRAEYLERRDYLVPRLAEAGFTVSTPEGAYYIMAGFDRFGYDNDRAFARYLVREVGLAVVPGSSFFPTPEEGSRYVRFVFCKKQVTLERAVEKFKQIKPVG